MAKRPETLMLEDTLHKDTRNGRFYGCEEVTIGFANNGHGNEIVDFMTMDSKGIIKCYELKVTLQDLKSNAKKSWYGHYNYLVTTYDLYKKVENWDEYIPGDVGIILGGKLCLESVRRAKKKEISKEDEIMLKESMIRSIYYKMIKYKDSSDPLKQKELNAKLRKTERERESYRERAVRAENTIYMYERYKAANDGVEDISLEKLAKEEKEKWMKKNRPKTHRKDFL